MEDELVKPDTARMLKELGFSECTNDFYFNGWCLNDEDCDLDKGENYNAYPGFEDEELCSAPTQSLALRWLREKHNIQINIGFYTNYDDKGKTKGRWAFDFRETTMADPILRIMDEWIRSDYGDPKTYEEAAEIGIWCACKYLKKKILLEPTNERDQ